MERRKVSEQEVLKFSDDRDKLNKMIKETKEKALEKEGEKKILNEETIRLREAIERQKKVLTEK